MTAAASNSARRLYGYFRSSASYRVRIALALKGLGFEHLGVHLVRGGGEQHTPEFRQTNPLGLVPVYGDGPFQLTQSLAIIEYLDERYPDVPLLPRDLEARARAREIALTVACDIHPLNNPRATSYLAQRFEADQAAREDWMRHWMMLGFEALEMHLKARSAGDVFCVGNEPTIADCCLVPQVFNAIRFRVDMGRYPTIAAIAEACNALPPFELAHPSSQPDAE